MKIPNVLAIRGYISLISFLVFFSSCQHEGENTRISTKTDFSPTKEEILKIAENISFESKSNGRVKSKKIKSLSSVKDQNNQEAIHIINFQDGGFLILSGDKRTRPILAYSNESTFPTNKIPSGLNEWLGITVSGIEGLRNKSIGADSSILREWDNLNNTIIGSSLRTSIEPPTTCTPTVETVGPLLATNWGQGCGFNNLLKTEASMGCSNLPCDRAYTGCVATAMAQIMRFHSFPTSYSWTAMSNTNPTLSGDRGNAVSTLMRDIGSRVSMNYSCDGSGANTKNKVIDAFKSFGYSPNMRYLSYPTSSTNITNDLNSRMPVLFKGGRQGNWFIFPVYEDGHAWVCDGYQKNNNCTNTFLNLHMNWGWDGSWNGWYSSSNFNPGGGDFNYQSAVIVGIKK
jgi:streptopain